MPISIKKIMTVYAETVQKTTNRFSSSSSQEWYMFPTASLATTATSLEAAAAAPSTSDKNLAVSVEPTPRKGSWDFVAEQEEIKEESDLESMIQCTSTFF